MWFGRSQNSGLPDKSQMKEAKQRAEAAEQALLRGKLPLSVTTRIDRQLNDELPWTSDFTVNEWLLLRIYGFEALGFVSGSSCYHISYSGGSGFLSGSYDMENQEDVLYAARERALLRMEEEASLLGANAVVGVRLQLEESNESHQMAFSAFGTAVRIRNLVKTNKPIVCTVSGQEFVKLLAQGAMPIGMSMGIAVFYQYSSRTDMRQTRSFFNQEVPVFTEAIYHVQRRAMNHLHSNLNELNASGLLGDNTHFFVKEMEVERGENDTRIDHIVHFIVAGTAIHDLTYPLPLQVKTTLNLL